MYHEELQRSRLRDFTSWELQDSGCWFLGADAKVPELSDSIHPILEQRNWVKVDQYPRNNGLISVGAPE
jgi:hypothetical protein